MRSYNERLQNIVVIYYVNTYGIYIYNLSRYIYIKICILLLYLWTMKILLYADNLQIYYCGNPHKTYENKYFCIELNLCKYIVNVCIQIFQWLFEQIFIDNANKKVCYLSDSGKINLSRKIKKKKIFYWKKWE